MLAIEREAGNCVKEKLELCILLKKKLEIVSSIESRDGCWQLKEKLEIVYFIEREVRKHVFN